MCIRDRVKGVQQYADYIDEIVTNAIGKYSIVNGLHIEMCIRDRYMAIEFYFYCYWLCLLVLDMLYYIYFYPQKQMKGFL